MRAICLGARVPYVPKCDREVPESERTTFWLRPLSARDVIALSALEQSDMWGAMLQAAHLGLVGWTNYRSAEDGSPVEFRRDEAADPASQPYLASLDPDVLSELYAAVCAAGRVSRADAGKSTTPSV